MIPLASVLALALQAAPAEILLRGASVPACSAAVTQHADEGADHAVSCTQVTYGTIPPTSGTHYASWAAYKTYDKQVPAGFLVHSLEHGAVVIGYKCPEGCADEVALVQSWINTLGTDPLCTGLPHKIILAPNPDIDVRWAAAAWNWTWKAPCADTVSLAAFFRAHYGKTIEAGVCVNGIDQSSVGWCPGIGIREGKALGNLRNTPGSLLLWSGNLERRARLRVEMRAADGSLLATEDLGEAGPGAAQAVWQMGQAGKARPSEPVTGPVLLQVRTDRGELLAGRLALP